MKAYFFEINSILVFVDVVVGAASYPFACSRPIRGALILKSFIMIPSQAQHNYVTYISAAPVAFINPGHRQHQTANTLTMFIVLIYYCSVSAN